MEKKQDKWKTNIFVLVSFHLNIGVRMRNRARMPIFLGDNVAASSVTGTGPGDSNGKYKPQNNGSCGCTSPSNPATISTIKRKKGCVISHGSGSKFVQYGHSSGALKIKSCF